MRKKKFFITTTAPQTLFFFKTQCKELKGVYDIRAISTGNELLRTFGEQEGIPVIPLGMEREISIFKDIVSFLKWIFLLLKERPYVVHGNTPKASLLSMVAAWLTQRPVRIYMCHGLRYQGCEGRKRKLLMTMERITCRCATQVLCVSQGVREQFAEDNICPLSKSHVVLYGSANGVDTERFNPDVVPDDAIDKGNYSLILFIGRQVRDKGIVELVEAVSRLKNEGRKVKLLMVGGKENGTNPLPESIASKIKKSDFIVDVGPQSDVRPWIKASDILVLPSYREGFGQVLIEAGSMGVPVIASNIVGCRSVVQEGVNGLLCEPRNTDSLYDAIVRLLNDKELYHRIADGCRQYTIDHFSHENVKTAFIEYYKALVS